MNTVPDPTNPVDRSQILASYYHINQRYGEDPYMVHLEQVHEVLSDFGFSKKEALMAAGYLHDCMEDQGATKERLILDMVPPEVIALVEAVTDEPGANRADRKAKTYPKIRAAGKDAVALKLADRIANVEAGSKIEMYRSEHRAFKKALYDAQDKMDSMWGHLDRLLSGSRPP